MSLHQPTDVILHAFDWPYALVAERASAIFEAGYKAVLISPPMKSAKVTTELSGGSATNLKITESSTINSVIPKHLKI